MDALIYGKDETKGIVSLSAKEDKLHIFKSDGTKDVIDCDYYIIYNKYLESYTDGRLDGTQSLKYFSKFKSKKELYDFEQILKSKNIEYFKPRSPEEGMMIKGGFTYYKSLEIKDLNVLSFDLETTGATIDENSYVLLISNTFRDAKGNIEKKLFAFDDYDKPELFIKDWCKWVRSKNPDILLGHNIFGFDFPYLRQFCKNQKIDSLHLGRDASKLYFNSFPSQFRKDGSQSYDYNNVICYGREIIDTMFLSIKYDIKRKYESYRLKQIIAQEGLEKENRQHYDASLIRKNFTNPIEWAKIKAYAIDDADDALALFDLMAPSFFYYTQIIPMSFQNIINRASGSQVNNLMLRSYLQNNESIPEASSTSYFQGAISFGNPGLYNNVYKIDVASLYPSIIIRDQVYHQDKDPKANFLYIVKKLTEERLKNKELGESTGQRIYKDLSESQKIVINSAYGFLGAPGLNFNYPTGAAKVTEQGRNILNLALEWAKSKNYTIPNADTDSICFTNENTLDINKELDEINNLSGAGINWTNDGFYKKVVIVKAKNYILQTDKKVTIKGSALKATMKEKALQIYINEVIDIVLKGNLNDLLPHYELYVEKICNITDISDWCSKKTITKKVLSSERTNESRIADAIEDAEDIKEGDKIFVFFEKLDVIKQKEDFKGVYSRKKLLEKLYKTVKIFETVIDVSQFKNYSLKKNQKELLNRKLLFEIE